jgi:hypothetical protein
MGPTGPANGPTGPTGATGAAGATGATPAIYGTANQITAVPTGATYTIGLPTNLQAPEKVTADRYISRIYTATYAATTVIDMADGDNQYLNILGDVDIQLTGITEGQSLLLRIDADGTTRNLTFPIDWKWFPNGTVPTTLAANSTGLLALFAWSNVDSGIVAAWTS